MRVEKITSNIIVIMVAIYAIQSAQYIFREAVELTRLIGLSYSQKLDHLDSSYYHNIFYRYYAWLNSILPPEMSFSMLFQKPVEWAYLRYERKLNYYLYPRYILPGEEKLLGYERGKTKEVKDTSAIIKVKYSDLVFVISNKKAGLSPEGRLKRLVLNGRAYYLVATLDDKGLLAEGGFIRKNILRGEKWGALREEFKSLYGFNIDEAGL